MELKGLPFFKLSPSDIPRPWLPVTITNPHTGKSVTVLGLVDTGADECAIPASYAAILGHNLQAVPQKDISTGNGVTAAYPHTVSIKFNDFEIANVLIDFLPNLNVVLIGVKSFLSNFIVIIDYKESTLSLLEKNPVK
jgi:predicted aspartyl protease